MGLILSMGLTSWYMAKDMEKIKREDRARQTQTQPQNGAQVQNGQAQPQGTQIDPATGQPTTAGQIDPATGQSVQTQPSTGSVDPATGQQVPATGAQVDPATTQPSAATPTDPAAATPSTGSVPVATM